MARHVAAIVWEGQSGLAMRGAFGGLVGLTPAIGASSHYGRISTDLAAALAPPPAPPSRGTWFGWIIALLTVAMCLTGLVVMIDGQPSGDNGRSEAGSPWPGLAVIITPIAAVIVLLVVLLVRRLRQDQRWRRAMPEMGAVWSTAKYCARCAVAFLPRSEVPPSLPDRTGPGGFRGLVWQAGIIRHEAARRELGDNSALH